MSTVAQWPFILTVMLVVNLCHFIDSKVFERCELAKTLRQRHRLDLQEVAQWVCIVQHSSGFNTAAQAFSPSGGSHGLFQISDVYWCSPPGKGAGCNIPCHKLRDDNLSDDLSCAKRIYDEHQRISGDGYTAWNAYQQFCRHNAFSYIQDCFPAESKLNTYAAAAKGFHSHQTQYHGNAIEDYSPKKRGKIYERCELARELYHKHKMPLEQIPTWVCIAEHESCFDTAAVGRLNADGSADHGLFQISDLYWCSHDRYSGGKACGLSCSKLLDDDLTDDVRCIKRIHNEHTAISGDGFNAWTVYKPYCQNQRYEQVANCFKNAQPNYQQQKLHSTNKQSVNTNNPFFKSIVKQSPSKTHYTTSSTSTYNGIHKTSSNTNSASSRASSHKGKVYTRCSLAQELYFKHNFSMQDISTWVCIAEHESQFDTAAIGRLNTDGSADHGLFQISDKYWCSQDAYGGKACNMACDKLLDDDLRDDVQCIRTIYEEHTRISGDGFNAWTVYRPHCQNQNIEYIQACFDEKTVESKVVIEQEPFYDGNISKGKGKIYNKCELAKELYHKHHMPMEQIPKWVCIAKHESSFNTAAVGRLNTDGSADHGLFQISDLYWCAHDRHGGKACNIPCDKLLDSDITDDVKCIKIIYEEHTRISGDGFNAWTVYKPHCRNTGIKHIKDCFTEQELTNYNNVSSTAVGNVLKSTATTTKTIPKGKIYQKCELAHELLSKYKMPMEQIPTWVCIAEYESSLNTAAVGHLNADGSLDHGLFQISDLYWCSHDKYGGKACNIPCDKLLDSDIRDDVRCIKIIYEEHTRISGDGFNAWTVYKPHCHNRKMSEISSCFTTNQIQEYDKKQTFSYKTINYQSSKQTASKSSYSNNPFLSGFQAQTSLSNQKQSSKEDLQFASTNQTPIYANNPFLASIKTSSNGDVHKQIPAATQGYKQNPFLNGSLMPSSTTLQNNQRENNKSKTSFNQNPFLNGVFSTSVNSKTISKPAKDVSNEPFKTNPFLSAIKPTQTSQFNTLNKENPFINKNENKYKSSNSFRTTTTTFKPRTTATARTTEAWNTYNTATRIPKTTTTTLKSETTTRTTTKKPFIPWNAYSTTTRNPSTTTTRKAAVGITKSTKTTSWTTTSTTTKKPNANITTKTTKSIAVLWNGYTSTTEKPTTSNTPKIKTTTTKSTTQRPVTTTTTKKPTTTLKTTTTKLPITKWNWQRQTYTNNITLPQIDTKINAYKLSTTTPKPEGNIWNWKHDQNMKTTTTKPSTWNWRNEQNLKATNTQKTAAAKYTLTAADGSNKTTIQTTKKIASSFTTTTKSALNTTTRKPEVRTTTQKTTTTKTTTRPTASWQKYEKATTTTRKQSSNTATPKSILKSTTRKPEVYTTTQKSTTTKPTNRTTTSWQKYDKITTRRPSSNTTTLKPTNKKFNTNSITTTTKPIKKTTANWQNYDKITTIKPGSSIITTKPAGWNTTTQKPTTKTTYSWWSTTTKSNTAKPTKSLILNTTNKPITYEKPYTNIKTTSSTKTTKASTTSTQKPITKAYDIVNDYEKYKKDPFSHPFFAKVNERIKELKGNTTTTKRPTLTNTKLQNLPHSALYQDFKNTLSNKTNTIVAYNFEATKSTTTKRPKL